MSQDAGIAEATPLWRRVLFGAFVTAAVLVFLAALLYRFGSMWPADRETRAAYAALEEAGQAPPLEPRFHIPVPGCVCHSDSPVTTMQHADRRISDCMGCH
jgi:hypothetical protein